MKKRYETKPGVFYGQRLTDCCGCYSEFIEGELSCKACKDIVDIGEGDGCEWSPDVPQPAEGLSPKEISDLL